MSASDGPFTLRRVDGGLIHVYRRRVKISKSAKLAGRPFVPILPDRHPDRGGSGCAGCGPGVCGRAVGGVRSTVPDRRCPDPAILILAYLPGPWPSARDLPGRSASLRVARAAAL